MHCKAFSPKNFCKNSFKIHLLLMSWLVLSVRMVLLRPAWELGWSLLRWLYICPLCHTMVFKSLWFWVCKGARGMHCLSPRATAWTFQKLPQAHMLNGSIFWPQKSLSPCLIWVILKGTSDVTLYIIAKEKVVCAGKFSIQCFDFCPSLCITINTGDKLGDKVSSFWHP